MSVCVPPVQLRLDFLVIVGKGKTALGFPLSDFWLDVVSDPLTELCVLFAGEILWVMDNVFGIIYLQSFLPSH